MLPTDMLGEPDWQFMEDYIREREEMLIGRCREFLTKRITSIERERVTGSTATEPLHLDNRNWNPFAIEEVFTISSGKRLETRNKIPGTRPFAGAVDGSNGISGFVGNTNESLDKQVLGVNYNGSVGLCFYHPYEIIFSDDVKRFHLIDHPDNYHIMLFMKVVIEQQRIKYSYGYKFNATRMRRQTILLPTDMLGEPDWQFMEDYAKSIALKLLRQQLDYLDRLAATEPSGKE